MTGDRSDEVYGQFPLRDFLKFDLERGAGRSVAHLDVAERHLNPNGVVHGGVIYTLVDTAMGSATMSVLDRGLFCASIETQIRYLRPITSGTVMAQAEVLRAGRRIVQLEARVFVDGATEPAATASGSFAVIRP